MDEVGSPKKPKKEFVGRPAGDLRSALEEQLLLLLSHCEHYDNGERAFEAHHDHLEDPAA